MYMRSTLMLGLAAVSALIFAATLPVSAEQASQTGQQSWQHMSSRDFRVSDLLDKHVKNTRGEDVGKVDDLILMKNGKINHVVVSVGGFLGIGDRMVALPFNQLRFEGDRLVGNFTKEQLERMQEFKYEAFGLDQRPSFYAYRGTGRGYYYPGPGYDRYAYDRDRYRDYPRTDESFRYGEEQRHGYGDDRYRQYGQREPWFEEEGSRRYMRTFTPERFRASHLMDEEVVNHRGQELGEIHDLIISPDGTVRSFVIATDISGMKDKTVVQPFRSIRMNERGDLVLDVSEGALRRAPEFKMDKKS